MNGRSNWGGLVVDGRIILTYKQNKKLRGYQCARELYRQSDRRLSAKLVQTFADKECHVVSATESCGC
jgi:hypothetical protein